MTTVNIHTYVTCSDKCIPNCRCLIQVYNHWKSVIFKSDNCNIYKKCSSYCRQLMWRISISQNLLYFFNLLWNLTPLLTQRLTWLVEFSGNCTMTFKASSQCSFVSSDKEVYYSLYTTPCRNYSDDAWCLGRGIVLLLASSKTAYL